MRYLRPATGKEAKGREKRLQRLLKPVGVFVGLWAIGDTLARVLVPGYTGVTHWGMVVFVPLWFLSVYTGVVLLARKSIVRPVERLAPVIPPERLWILTNDHLRDEIVRQLPQIPKRQIEAPVHVTR